MQSGGDIAEKDPPTQAANIDMGPGPEPANTQHLGMEKVVVE